MMILILKWTNTIGNVNLKWTNTIGNATKLFIIDQTLSLVNPIVIFFIFDFNLEPLLLKPHLALALRPTSSVPSFHIF